MGAEPQLWVASFLLLVMYALIGRPFVRGKIQAWRWVTAVAIFPVVVILVEGERGLPGLLHAVSSVPILGVVLAPIFEVAAYVGIMILAAVMAGGALLVTLAVIALCGVAVLTLISPREGNKDRQHHPQEQ